MKTYISEKRNIIEENVNGVATYFVEFTTTTVTISLFSTNSKTTTEIDEIPFQTVEDAQCYLENVSKISQRFSDYGSRTRKKVPVRNQIFLKNDELFNKKYEMPAEFCSSKISDTVTRNVFGMRGTDKYDVSTFSEFLKLTYPERKVVKTYSVYELENIENDKEMAKLYAERNGIIEQEILRLKENINFLEKLVK